MENQLKELNNIQKQITNMRERHNSNIQAINDVMTTKQKYQNGKIYAIKSFQTNDVYYGSTTKLLSERLSGHKLHYRMWQNKKYHYVTSFEIIKYDDCYIELYELCPCNSKTELEKREGQIIRVHDDAINQRIAGRTKKEYYVENSIAINQHTKQYYLNNIDKMKECFKQYRENNKESIKQHKSKICECECGSQYTHNHKSRHLKSTTHQNYENNVIIKKYERDEIYECKCGSKFGLCKKARHLKSKKHIQYLESLI
jgi:hypothetical protein